MKNMSKKEIINNLFGVLECKLNTSKKQEKL